MSDWNENQQADEIIRLNEEITVLKDMIVSLQRQLSNAHNRICPNKNQFEVIVTNGPKAYSANIKQITISRNGLHTILCEGII